jgi:Ca-activated chloride channel family protein
MAAIALWFSSASAARAQQPDGDIQLRRDLVTFTVTVRDRMGRCVWGLDKPNFEVYDGKVKQEVTFFSDEDMPLNIGIIFDVSGSMITKMDAAKHALAEMLERSHPDDDIFVMSVADQVSLVHDFTPNAPTIANSLSLATGKGRTALFDAVYAAVLKARMGRHEKRALIIISDGQDNNSRYSYAELRELLRESDVAVYSIGIIDPAEGEFALYGQAVLEGLSSPTGGIAYFPMDSEGLFDVCTHIALELRHQYSIGFYPTGDGRGESWHKLRVKIKGPPNAPKLSALHRAGYFGATR